MIVPTILPSLSMSILTAAGRFGNPGILIILPEIATKNPAPADGIRSLILTVKPLGRPSRVG